MKLQFHAWVCDELAPDCVKSVLEDYQTITCFLWGNSLNHRSFLHNETEKCEPADNKLWRVSFNQRSKYITNESLQQIEVENSFTSIK